jgi:alpha-N-arabinofuranosidase
MILLGAALKQVSAIRLRLVGVFAAGLSAIGILHAAAETSNVVVRVTTAVRSPHRIPANLTGKFAEHLGQNIVNGMDAQILRNPTFADYPIWTGQTSPDGLALFHYDREAIAGELRRLARRWGCPENDLENLIMARQDGLAAFWIRSGDRVSVEVSPDTGPAGGRAQRVSVRHGNGGIAQWVWLPLHRVRAYDLEIMARSPDISSLVVAFTADGATQPAARATVTGLTGAWQKLRTRLELPLEALAEAAYRLDITAASPGQIVFRHLFLRPADHVQGADPDVIRLLRESRLPILRWPGGNFVSGYHWEDGIGPVEQRPTRANPAWGGVEPNLFGTAEFVQFCRAVGCEPMICVNAGDGTPAEAARWIEYCNGPASTPMGARRAADGFTEPFRVRHWEVGNELWGRWQVHWTTAAGYVDRYRAFSQTMRAADPTMRLYACGAPVFWGKDWNKALIAGLGRELGTTTDHPLIGGEVSPDTEPLDVYRDFMGVPQVLEQKWAALRAAMELGGVREPRLAVTELQLFARIGRASGNAPARLRPENFLGQATLGEGLYDVLIYHAAVRLAPFVEMITHSATVNHGGGLRKERERVYANPCHHAQAMFAALAGATPVGVEVQAPVERAPRVLPDLRSATPAREYPTLDALAALGPAGDLWLSLVHRGTAGALRLTIELPDYPAAARAEVRTLAAEVPWAANTLARPDAVQPVDSTAEVHETRLALELPPYALVRVRLPPR